MHRREPLPIDEVLPELMEALRAAAAAVLVAPPGAGKTTRVPPALIDEGMGTVLVVEPRRLSARAAARRVAAERGWALGQEVGYHVRFDRKAGPRTQVLYCTDGILLRRLQDDPFLEGVGCLLFDEFHERRLGADLALAMARRVQQQVREDLRLIVTSATLEAEPVARFLGGAAIVKSEGRMFPVETHFAPPAPHGGRREPIEDHVARTVREALDVSGGDVLVFLPGVGEIRRSSRRLASVLRAGECDVCELFGDLPPGLQDAALRVGARRRVVLSTNVAESSVTVQGVRAVVDTGLARVLRNDRAVGLDRLAIERIDRAAADQRRGRAGREGAGHCWRLWSLGDDRALVPQLEAEVRRLDLAGPVLELLCWGETDPSTFPWFEPPPADMLERALALLRTLHALDEAGQPTARGRALCSLPVHPRLAAMVLEGVERGAPRRAALAAAILSERDPFRRDRHRVGKPDGTESDLCSRIFALEEFEDRRTTSFPIGELNPAAARAILRVCDQLLRLVRPGHGNEDPDGLARAVFAGFPDRLCRRRPGDPERAVMVGGRGVRLSPTSAVTEAELFVAVDVSAGTNESLVRMASYVEREWIDGGRTRTEVQGVFDEKSGRAVGRRRVLLGGLVLEESDHPLHDASECERVLLEAARSDPARALLLNRPEIEQWRARVAWLAEWRSDLELPPFDEAACRALLPMVVPGCRSLADLAKAPLIKVFLGTLTHAQRSALEREAPERLKVPSGSQVRLTYEAGRPPVLAVRIQELYGLAESPTVAGGRVRVLLHLLAPNGRPQQVTDDLASFWGGAYHTVRKELRARYPKHDWPENPQTATPSSRPARRRPG
ncbi:MAG: ATP-dependent helicase HrpB [Planctomycetes bacterium]|jgi:ATP-dependent helicase HrpB|nr:ATP-dependent helicase HrpB [Planctomycetota bacterium]